MVQTVQKNIRITPEQWERIEKAADERRVSANQLLVELAMEGARPRPIAPHRGGNPSPALRNVHRPGHGSRPGGSRARRRDRRNRKQHLQDRPGIAARDGPKLMTAPLPRPTIAPWNRRVCAGPTVSIPSSFTTLSSELPSQREISALATRHRGRLDGATKSAKSPATFHDLHRNRRTLPRLFVQRRDAKLTVSPTSHIPK